MDPPAGIIIMVKCVYGKIIMEKWAAAINNLSTANSKPEGAQRLSATDTNGNEDVNDN